MSEIELPEGWASVQISDVAQVNPRKTKEDRLDDELPLSFVPMAAVDADSGAITEPEERSFGDVKKGYTHFRDEDVIFARITPCMENGKAAVARGLLNGVGVGSTEFHVIRPNGAVLPEYVYHFIRQVTYRHVAAVHMTGAVGQARVPADFVRDTELPLAPLAEQERIVAAAEELLDRIRTVRDRLDRVPAILRRFRQSVLAAACDGRLTEDWRVGHPDVEPAKALLGRIEAERRARLGKKYKAPAEPDAGVQPEEIPEGWSLATVEAVAQVATGATPLRSKGDYYEGGTIPWIKSGAVNDGLVESADEYITPLALAETNVKLFPAGSLIVAMYGEGQTRGRVAELGIEATTNQALAALVFEESEALCKSFVKLSFLNRYEALRRLAMGGVQPNLNLGIIRSTTLLLPPEEEQAEIVRRADALLALADKVEGRVAVARRHSERAAQAVLAKAFRGELVPTEAELARAEGRDYETAQELLARVKAEATAGSNKKPKVETPKTLAGDLVSQPSQGSVNGEVPAPLREAAAAGARTTPRELLSWFGQKRRGAAVVERVRSALNTLGAGTHPDLLEAGMDEEISLVQT